MESEPHHTRTEVLPLNAPYQGIVVASALIFMSLPFVTAFNEFLTAIVVNSGAYTIVQLYVVPFESRMVAGIIHGLFGIPAVVSLGGQTVVVETATRTIRGYISWNCIGWQSLILFILTLASGLRGNFTKASKGLAVLLGFEGIVLLNLARIVIVLLVAISFGTIPAIIFHDYAGTLILLVWLVAFWHFSYNHILRPFHGDDAEAEMS